MFTVKKLVLAAFLLALGFVLPFATMQIPAFGSMLLPMHLPVLLAGFVCGWPLAVIVGFILPILRSVVFTMPPMFPTAIAMSFELATYGLLTGIVYASLAKKPTSVYISLVIAMLGGRIVWGSVTYLLMGYIGNAFTFELFIAGAFGNALPGIILQFLVIPSVVFALEKSGLLENVRKRAFA